MGCAARAARRPWWAIAGLAAIATLALALYTWSLSRNGMANSYYAAAVKSATLSWKAFFFGSLDPGSFITIDKPPAAVWLMALSARIFGFSSWSMLLPQALAGVASVLVLYRLVRRWRGEAAALLAALAFALTPVTALIFRYNNPDALLVLLLLLATWALWSAVESGSTLKLGLAGAALGFAFLTKMSMAFLVTPAFVAVYLLCGPHRIARRALQLLVPLATTVAAGGWWLAIVELWPDSTRPYVGGTTSDSWLDLALGRTAGYLGGSGTAAPMGGELGLSRVFNTALGGQVSWLIPFALVALVVGLWVTRRAPRTDRTRAGYLLWGLWSVVMIVLFGFAQGTFHSYYTAILAPAIAALAGAGAVELWRLGREQRQTGWLTAAMVAGSAAWSVVLLGRVSGYAPGLATAVAVLGALGGIGVLAITLVRPGEGRKRQVCGVIVGVVCLVALLAGPVAYDVSTIDRAVTGNSAAAGPAATGLGGVGTSGTGLAVSSAGPATPGGGEDLGADAGLIAYLREHQGQTKYLVAVQTSTASVPIILTTGEPVLTIGGYKSRDPYPTAERLASLVAAGELRYVLVDGDAGSGGSFSFGEATETTEATLRAVLDWVVANGTVVAAEEYGGDSEEGTLYHLP